MEDENENFGTELEKRIDNNDILETIDDDNHFQQPKKRILNLKNKKFAIILLILFIIFNIFVISSSFSVGIGIGIISNNGPIKSNQLDMDFSGISFYSTYLKYNGAPFVYHKPSDYQIDRTLPIEKDFLETNEYKISLDISHYSNRMEGIEEMKNFILSSFPFDFNNSDIEEDIYEEHDYKLKNCDVDFDTFRLRTYFNDDEVNTSEVELFYEADSFDDKRDAVKTDLTPAPAYYSHSEIKIEQGIHPCSYKYTKKSKIKKLSEDFTISTCEDAAVLFPTSSFANSKPTGKITEKDSSPSYSYDYKISSYFQYNVTQYHLSWSFQYDNLNDAKVGDNPPLKVDFSLRTFSPRDGKESWDYQLLTRVGEMYQSLLDTYGSTDYPCA